MDSYDKTEIVAKIKSLLATVESVDRINKYKYVCEIYSTLGANKQFVLDHPNFYKTFLSNANQIIESIIGRHDISDEEEHKLMYSTLTTIIDTVSTITI